MNERGDNQQPFGYIYLLENKLNGKVYIGQIKASYGVKKRFKKHLGKGRSLANKRVQFPNKRINGTHIQNAMAIYGENVWNVKNVDIASNKIELNNKEKQ